MAEEYCIRWRSYYNHKYTTFRIKRDQIIELEKNVFSIPAHIHPIHIEHIIFLNFTIKEIITHIEKYYIEDELIYWIFNDHISWGDHGEEIIEVDVRFELDTISDISESVIFNTPINYHDYSPISWVYFGIRQNCYTPPKYNNILSIYFDHKNESVNWGSHDRELCAKCYPIDHPDMDDKLRFILSISPIGAKYLYE